MSEPAIPRELIDLDAQKVIRHLSRSGYTAYLVGGCVRDLLLGRTPKDFDVATSATPSEIRDLFRNCRIIGRRFRLAHVVFGRKIIETATFRANPRGDADESVDGEGDVGDVGELYIHRDNVFGTAEEDSRRRDFTINGLFYDMESGRVIDYVGGLDDLAQRHIRTIGEPNIRFREDPVRILRAIKFAARLSFDIEDQTYRAMIAHHAEIKKSAAPRVLEEIYRLMRGGAAVESLVLLKEVGVLELLLPEVAGWLRERPAALDSYLLLLDEHVLAGDIPSNAVLLCILCAPAMAMLFDDATAPRDLLGYIEETLDPLAMRLRVSRRDVERARQMLVIQRRIAQARKRGGRFPASLLSRDYASEALGLHALFFCAARLDHGASKAEALAEVRTWQLPKMPRLGSEEPPPPRERRRRRRPGHGDELDAEIADELAASRGTPPPAGDEDAAPAQARAADDDAADALGDVDEDAVYAAFAAALNRRED
jgi:poly(A) polymerase